MNHSETVIQGLLSAAFLTAGSTKLAGQMQEVFDHFGYPPWFRVVTGVTETTIATCLAAGLQSRSSAELTAAGSLLACGTMTGAVWSHLVRGGDPPSKALPAATLLAASGWLAWRSLRQLARRGSATSRHAGMPRGARASGQFASAYAG
jgi:hypothetical protein